MEEILRWSRTDTQDAPSAETSSGSGSEQLPNYKLKQELSGRLSALDAEIKGVDEDIDKLKAIRKTLVSDRNDLLKKLNMSNGQKRTASSSRAPTRVVTGKTDYTSSDFEWSGELRARMKDVFGIQDFRLCQEGCVIYCAAARFSA